MAQGSPAARTKSRTSGFAMRWAGRAVWTLVALALIGCLGWLLSRPFWHPRTHLVLLAGDIARVDTSPSAVPADYVLEDLRELLTLESVLHRGLGSEAAPLIFGALGNPGEMKSLADRLNERITGHSDALLAYATAHGLSQDGDAWLLARGADPQSALGGRYRLSGLLASLAACRAETKVLILDAGRIDYDPLRGMLDNEFSTLLIDQVEQLGDGSLWVLLSHSAGERSHLSPALRRSVFGYFVAEGLKGGADRNQDQSVDLAELARFVTSGVSGWVRETTGGAAEQTPRLIWGRGTPLPRSQPVLLAVRQSTTAETHKVDHSKSIESARQSIDSDNRLASQGRSELNTLIATSLARATPQGRIGQYASDTARQAFSNAMGATPKIPGTSSEAKAPAIPTEANATTPKTDKPAEAASATKESIGDNSKKDPAPDEKSGKASQDEIKSAAVKQAPAAAPPAVKPAAVSREQLAEQLRRGWQLRDEVAAPSRPQSRPVDYAPHLWRDLEERLLSLDRELRTGFLLNNEDLARQLDEVVRTLEWLAGDQQHDSQPANPLAERFAAARPGRAWTKTEPHSLALAELIACEGRQPVAPELLALLARLDQQIASGNRPDLEKLAQSLKPEHERWIELRVVRLLAERAELDWRLVHLLLAVTRASEQAAATRAAAPAWQREELERTDLARLSVERTLLAHGSFDRDAMIAGLTTALEAYRAVIAKLAAITTAERLAHDVWHRLPYYLAWNAAANGAPGIGPSADALVTLIAELDGLEALLDDPAPDKIAAVKQASARLSAAQAGVEKSLDPLAIEQTLNAPVSSGETWRIEVLLETPLPSAAMRAALVAALPEIDAALATQVKAVPVNDGAGPPNLLRRDFDRFAVRADLQRRMWQAALRRLASPDLAVLTEAWQLWSKPAPADPMSDSATLTAAREQLETALADLNRGLPARLQKGLEQEQDLTSRTSRGPRLARLRAWNRALRLVDPRLLALIGEETPALALADAAAYDLLAWRRDRAERASEDAPPLIATYLQSVAEAYRAAAGAIPRQPAQSSGPHSPLELIGPARIALTYEVEQNVEFAIRNSSSAALAAWIVADWEPEFVSLTSSGQQAIYRWSDWHSESSETDGPKPQSGLPQARPSLQLAPGQTIALPIRLARRQAALTASHVVLRVVTEQHVARHDLIIELPRPEDLRLAIAGPAGRWTPTESGVTLFPFPNRSSAFVLQLASGQASERKVDVEVFPLLSLPARGVPTVPLTEADAARMRRELSAGSLVAEARGLTLSPVGKQISIPLLVPEPKAAPAAAATTPAANVAADEKSKAKAPMGDKPRPVPLTQGLLIIITDLADKRQTFKHIEIAPQRPQRYIRAQVRYRAGRERIEIRASPQDIALLPPEGVRIHGEIAEGLAPDTVRQLDAVLKPPLAEAEMHVDVPSSPGSNVTLRLTVDDYPRAIYYRVPTSGETSDVPEDMDLLAVRVAELPKGMIYQPPTATIPVKLEIDAPASALKNPPLRVEVGVDRNRDRELRGDEIVVLTADRQVEASLIGVGKTGELEIDTQVRDFIVDVPAAVILNGRANILAHAVLGEKEAWSEPIEIVVDGQAPRVSAVELRPDRVAVIGSDLVVSALVDDLGLSGVAKLEAMFDLDRSGQIGPMAKPVAGALGEDGRWTAKVPTAGMPSGAMSVLVRAVDRAGNASEPVRTSVRLLSADEAAADAKTKNSADITGVVMYGDQPQAGMKVSLAVDTGAPPPSKGEKKKKGDAKPALASATTDAQGQFKFPRVAPGKYVVSAEGLVRNNNRTAEQAVAFEKPQDVQPLTLKLK